MAGKIRNVENKVTLLREQNTLSDEKPFVYIMRKNVSSKQMAEEPNAIEGSALFADAQGLTIHQDIGDK